MCGGTWESLETVNCLLARCTHRASEPGCQPGLGGVTGADPQARGPGGLKSLLWPRGTLHFLSWDGGATPKGRLPAAPTSAPCTL